MLVDMCHPSGCGVSTYTVAYAAAWRTNKTQIGRPAPPRRGGRARRLGSDTTHAPTGRSQ